MAGSALNRDKMNAVVLEQLRESLNVKVQVWKIYKSPFDDSLTQIEALISLPNGSASVKLFLNNDQMSFAQEEE